MSEEVIESVTRSKKKNDKHEDFIGQTFNNGKLKVIAVHGKIGRATVFRVTCDVCSPDTELFPDGYFICTKGNLKAGNKPCGCALNPKWKSWQYLILARRAAKDRFIVHGFAEKYKDQKTKLNLECLKDGHKWVASIHNTINGKCGCPVCANNIKAEQKRKPINEVIESCIKICVESNYEFIGFASEYKNFSSRLEFVCKIHGKQEISYQSFINGKIQCSGCRKEKQKELGNGNGYYPERKDEIDYLYILSFDNKFIKVGRSFNVDERIRNLRSLSKIKKIHKLRMFTATHQEIYDYEQELHTELRERNFQHCVDWSTECFENESLFILNKLLDICEYKSVY